MDQMTTHQLNQGNYVLVTSFVEGNFSSEKY